MADYRAWRRAAYQVHLRRGNVGAIECAGQAALSARVARKMTEVRHVEPVNDAQLARLVAARLEEKAGRPSLRTRLAQVRHRDAPRLQRLACAAYRHGFDGG